MDILEKLPPLEDRLAEVESQLSDPTVASDPKRLRDLGKSHSQLRDIVTTGRELRKVLDDLGEAKGLLNSGDAEMKELAQEEIRSGKHAEVLAPE